MRWYSISYWSCFPRSLWLQKSSKWGNRVSRFLLTCHFYSGNTVKFVKNGEKDIEAVLQRLTQGEAWITETETLEAVHDPIQNVRVVMDSEQPHSSCILSPIYPFHLDGKASFNNDGEALGRFYWRQRASSMSERTIGILRRMANDENKSKRQFLPKLVITEQTSLRSSGR
jgi:hypothetical protein